MQIWSCQKFTRVSARKTLCLSPMPDPTFVISCAFEVALFIFFLNIPAFPLVPPSSSAPPSRPLTSPSQTLPFSLCHPRPRDTSPLAVVIPLLMCEYQLGKKREGQREGECGQSITVSRPEVSALNSWTLCISLLFLVKGNRKKMLKVHCVLRQC